MNKKVVKISLIMLIILSINIISYGYSYSETDFNVDEYINFEGHIKEFFVRIFDNIVESYEYIVIGFEYIEINIYMILTTLLIYMILNLLIIRDKKDFIKLSTKINAIILLIFLLLISSRDTIEFVSMMSMSIDSNIPFYIDIDGDSLNTFIVLGSLILLLFSILLQKILSNKDKEKIDKYNNKAKITIIILLVINLIVCIINYNYVILKVEKDIDNNKDILVEEVVLHDWDRIPNEVKRYTVSIGDYIQLMGEKSKVLLKDSNGIIIQDVVWIPSDNIKEKNEIKSLSNIFGGEQREIKREFKWNTWYNVAYEGERWLSMFIRFTKK